jgi:hypothetical protein
MNQKLLLLNTIAVPFVPVTRAAALMKVSTAITHKTKRKNDRVSTH